ncbi:MAG: SUMF1/EgtB/PvdO family nonheme iron enzyme [Candidatus Aminicenantes bacterium]|nr:SUMF1/EgtB/PvdO family nonheme iron enzyme [Candidatus Aminicenantes bacterium]
MNTKRLLTAVCGLALIAAVTAAAQEKTLVVDLGDGVGMEFILVPAGSFLMGAAIGDADEQPVHEVTITKSFYIGKYEVTQEQWQALMGDNLSTHQGPKHPVEQVSWLDCQDFLSKLRAKLDGLTPRLPTEAEWEYACRAGSKGAYHFGDRPADLKAFAWYDKNSKDTTHPVGGKTPNAWGLHDMHGNVYEWCADVYASDAYLTGAGVDPQGPESGTIRVARGGAWSFYAENCRSAKRFWNEPTFQFDNLGFRVVLEVAKN